MSDGKIDVPPERVGEEETNMGAGNPLDSTNNGVARNVRNVSDDQAQKDRLFVAESAINGATRTTRSDRSARNIVEDEGHRPGFAIESMGSDPYTVGSDP